MFISFCSRSRSIVHPCAEFLGAEFLALGRVGLGRKNEATALGGIKETLSGFGCSFRLFMESPDCASLCRILALEAPRWQAGDRRRADVWQQADCVRVIWNPSFR